MNEPHPVIARNSASPYYYHAHAANLDQASNQGQTLVHCQDHFRSHTHVTYNQTPQHMCDRF
jgi:hypothetical protein